MFEFSSCRGGRYWDRTSDLLGVNYETDTGHLVFSQVKGVTLFLDVPAGPPLCSRVAVLSGCTACRSLAQAGHFPEAGGCFADRLLQGRPSRPRYLPLPRLTVVSACPRVTAAHPIHCRVGHGQSCRLQVRGGAQSEPHPYCWRRLWRCISVRSGSLPRLHCWLHA